MDLIAPTTRERVRAALRDASTRRSPIAIIGGRTHAAKGNRVEVDRELSIAGLDRLVAFDRAEMLAVAEGGMRIGALREALAEDGQEWPADAPDEATVGGTVAAAPSSPRRLRFGPLRDTVVELELVTGDGRLVRSGARTVKSVQGYDVHRLATGSLGTLGTIVQVAVKVRPLPHARRVVVVEDGVETERRLLEAVPLPASIVATAERVEIGLEGWPEEIEEQTGAIAGVATVAEILDGDTPAGPEAIDAPVVVEAGVPPSKLDTILEGESAFRALIGVGIAWIGLPDDGDRLTALRRRVAEAGGIAPVIRGPGGLGDAPVPAIEVHRRLKAAFDPANILAPGRFWGGL
ncbi:MAG TPA: FAD-binding protein [Actinomycetota bacterium]|nr:FAD-binding protein [Actinomycetota bacterium]